MIVADSITVFVVSALRPVRFLVSFQPAPQTVPYPAPQATISKPDLLIPDIGGFPIVGRCLVAASPTYGLRKNAGPAIRKASRDIAQNAAVLSVYDEPPLPVRRANPNSRQPLTDESIARVQKTLDVESLGKLCLSKVLHPSGNSRTFGGNRLQRLPRHAPCANYIAFRQLARLAGLVGADTDSPTVVDDKPMYKLAVVPLLQPRTPALPFRNREPGFTYCAVQRSCDERSQIIPVE